MLGKPIVYKALFPLIALVMAIAWAPMAALSWLAPGWAELAEATELVGIIARGAAHEPGCKQANPYFLPGDTEFLWEPGPRWTLGFAKQNMTGGPATRANIKNGLYNMAGYGHMVSTDTMDDLFAKAIYLDDNTGRGGMLYAVVDCIGLSDTDANAIRALAWEWARAAGIKSIQVAATHVHSGIDTIGLWKDLPYDGKDEAFQRLMIEKTALALRGAYDARRNGRLFVADVDSGGLFEDTRPPDVFDKTITRFRFAPAETGGKDVYLLCANCHPEMVGPNNSVISADFPACAAAYIREATGAESMFIQGAIGALITSRDLQTLLDEHSKNNTAYGMAQAKEFGVEFARRALGEIGGVPVETELPPLLNIASAEIEVPIENLSFILALKLGIISHGVYAVHCKPWKYAFTAELSYLRLGGAADSVDILVQPGELAPEIAFGGFLPKENAALGTEYPRKPIFGYLNEYGFASERQIVFGMANNFMGYVVPENDFVVDGLVPYINVGTDRFGVAHYEETVSAGPRTAGALTEGFRVVFAKIDSPT